MFPVIVPLLAFGALGVVRHLGRNSGTSRPNPTAELSPFTVMGAFLGAGEAPPPSVVCDAVAYAEALGCTELAEDLVRVFVLPAMEAEASEARRAELGHPADGSIPHPRAAASAYAHAPLAWPGASSPAMAPTAASWPSAASATPAMAPTAASWPSAASATPATTWSHASSRVAAPVASGVVATHANAAGAAMDVEAQRVLDELADPASRAAKVEVLSTANASDAAEPEFMDSDESSPIDGVRPDAWLAFVGQVSREPPTFIAAHHVGQFRQRRERLRELGIDPSTVINSPDAQLAALDADMRDAYQHACASGLVDEYIGATVEVRVGDDVQQSTVTLSGVLGVMQAAGLEGAVQWLEQPADRTRFRNTTQAFLRCNGVF